eukprot:CAMPEP_0196148384 /NCGR_PEP_ID=MMETSP0910-20130528/27611_1 /TAXON_ID=49265 /ORGANISM="Thalassiosira rotula, Strain GSO102" /LENGTH=51 /DNA_ID=CAMNT_0041411073 /DNA_START=119 /DNA_END=271 /DNA_ORIENTATION=-
MASSETNAIVLGMSLSYPNHFKYLISLLKYSCFSSKFALATIVFPSLTTII